MAKRTKTTGNKRQRERDKRRKREQKEARRQERLEAKEQGGLPPENATPVDEAGSEEPSAAPAPLERDRGQSDTMS